MLLWSTKPLGVVTLVLIATSLIVSSAAGQVIDAAGSADNTDQNLKTVEHQSPQSSDLEEQPFLQTFGQDEWRMWTSPFRRSTYRSPTVRKYGIPFLVLSTAFLATDRRTADLLPNTPDQTKWSGRLSQVGASYTLAGISGSAYLLGRLGGNGHVKEAGWLGLQAIAHTQVFVFGIKQTTNRERPLDHDGHGSFWKGGNSFPSGHAATSFALATVFAYAYRDHIAVPITAYSLASVVAASRLSAQRHWVSDIFVGGSMGFLIGRYVYKNHHDPNLPGSPVSRTSRLLPEFGFGRRGLVLLWRL